MVTDALRAPSSDTYDLVPYDHYSSADTHPELLRARAKLVGVDAPPLSSARVLEIGCAQGWNLLYLAAQYPNARFEGLDRSKIQIQSAKELASKLELTNIQFTQSLFQELLSSDSRYDFIIVHGVLSWISPRDQETLIQVLSERLSENGLAFVSFNVRPAWHVKEHATHICRFFAQMVDDPYEKAELAQTGLNLIVEQLHEKNPHLSELLNAELSLMRKRSASYILHEYLEDYNLPLSFEAFHSLIHKYGLHFLGDTRMNGLLDYEVQPNLRPFAHQARARSPEAYESFCDIVRNRVFRRAVIGRRAPQAVDQSDYRKLFLLGNLQESDHFFFDERRGLRLPISDESERLLIRKLRQTFPYTVLCADFLDRVQHETTITPEVLQSFISKIRLGFIESFASNLPLCDANASEARLLAVVPLQASLGGWVSNYRGEAIVLDGGDRMLLGEANPQFSKKSLETICAKHFPNMDSGPRQTIVDAKWNFFVQRGLLLQ